MKKYQFLLFDADDTLLDFNAAEKQALGLLFAHLGLEFTPAAYTEYKQLSQRLWKDYERGTRSGIEAQEQRFTPMAQAAGSGRSPDEINALYQQLLAQQSFLIPSAPEVCGSLHRHYALSIITNGVASTQRSRIGNSPLAGFFPTLFISEEIGYQKPHPNFMKVVLTSLGCTDTASLLIIGDSLSADITAGAAMNIDTCWFNPRQETLTPGLSPTYTISTLEQLLTILE